jgi:hypothetical protein
VVAAVDGEDEVDGELGVGGAEGGDGVQHGEEIFLAGEGGRGRWRG